MGILKFIGVSIVFLIMYILGLLIVPFLYNFRDIIHKNKTKPFWYFLNDTKIGRDAGDFGRFKHNLIGFYKQNALRNSHWNLKLILTPKKGKKENVKGKLYFYTTNKPELLGFNFATYEIKGSKYFRMSFNIVFILLINMQLGAADNRYIVKIRINKKPPKIGGF